MFGDPLQRFTAGDGLGTIRADTLNALVDSAKLVRQRLSKGATGGGPRRQAPRPGALEVLAQNDTGGTLAEWSVVELLVPLVDATVDPIENQERPAFSAIAPTDGQSPVAVLAEPIPDGAVGRAVVMGVAVANLDVIDAAHDYCGPTAGVTGYLTTAETGPIRVLWKESGTGSKLGVVLLQEAGSSTMVTANVDGTEESTTARLEFDQTTGVRIDKGATDADPDVVSLVLHGGGLNVVVQACVSTVVTKTYSTTPGETHLLTDVAVTTTLVLKTRNVPVLDTGGGLAPEVCRSADTECCEPVADPATICAGGPEEASVSHTLKVVVPGGPTFFITHDGFGQWSGQTSALPQPDCTDTQAFGLILYPNCDGTWTMAAQASYRGPDTATVTPTSLSPFLLTVTGATESGLCGGTVTFTVEEV